MPGYVEIPLHLCQVLEEELENLPGGEHLTGSPPAGAKQDEVYVPTLEEGSPDAAGSPPGAWASPPASPRTRVTVREDWEFHDGHFKDRKRLAAVLSRAAEAWTLSHDGQTEPGANELRAERNLYAFLAFRYRGLWDTPGGADGASDEAFRITFNRMLRDEDEDGAPSEDGLTVFTQERFAGLALRSETRALLEVGAEAGGALAFQGAEALEEERGAGAGARAGRFARSDLARFRRLLLEDAFPDEIRRVYDLRHIKAVWRLHGAGRAALCFSGGGIRSGTFALGVIQSLARRGFLDCFDYLSTVSGGGYIGGWLTAWIHRHPRGLDGVIKDLDGTTAASRLDPEPEPLKHLRDYSNFITPRAGLLSADTWTFVVIYVRNLLLNWVVLIPLLASVLMIPRVATAVVLTEPGWRVLAGLLLFTGAGIFLLKPDRKTLWALGLLGVPSLAVILAGRSAPFMGGSRHTPFVAGTMLAAGTLLGGYVLAYMRLNRPSNSGAVGPGSFWDTHRDQASFIWFCLLPLTVSGSLLTTFWAWFRRAAGVSTLRTVDSVHFLGFSFGEFSGFLVYGLLLGLTGWLLYVVLAGLSWVGARGEVRRLYRRARRRMFTGVFKNAGRELLVTVCASVVGAVLLYVVAVKIPVFYDPVVEPFGRQTFSDRSVPELLPYTRWFYAELYTCLALPAYLFVFFLGLTLFTGFTSRRPDESPHERRRARPRDGRLLSWPGWLRFDYVEDEDREWLARASAWLFIVGGGWLFFGGLVIFGPLLLFPLGKWLAGVGGASGLLSLLGGRSSRTPGGPKQEGGQGWLQTLGVNLLVVAAFIFFACIVIAVSLLTGTFIVWLAQYLPPFLFGYGGPQGALEPLRSYFEVPADRLREFVGYYPFESPENLFRATHFPPWLYLFVLALGLQLFGRFFSGVINLNKFSLHAGYRDRIIRAFLGASRLRGKRDENPFTGFDPRDNLYMQELRPQLLRESDFRKPDALQGFVAELNRSHEELGNPTNQRERVAAFLRQRIEQGGASSRYFKDPPESIDFNPSFRSALFGDLNRILQDEEIPAGVDEASPPASPPADPAGDDTHGWARIRRNRERLSRYFDYIEPPPARYPLMHVVNMALNLVGGDRLAWQQRRAESFTASPLHSGSLYVGYRRTREYGGKNGISLGTAVAISGAAASSNMGYFSPSVFVTFVLTFFNARLGWWLGNPGARGADTYFRSHPQSALSPILDEAFGLTDDENPYVLLSDGGHFENLGLYEMIVRRCRNIVVVDGSADPEGSYDDLGGAVRKIRIDFGIPIDFSNKRFPILSRPDSEKKVGGYYAVGRVRYSAVDGARAEDGRLVYIKPAVYFTEPRDVFNYARSHGDFPHESTADQFFDEPQFESHRMLGYYILEQLFERALADEKGRHSCEQRDLHEFVGWLSEHAEPGPGAAGDAPDDAEA